MVASQGVRVKVALLTMILPGWLCRLITCTQDIRKYTEQINSADTGIDAAPEKKKVTFPTAVSA
jgi:hypothetical protein